MKQSTPQQLTAEYYAKLGSRIGHKLVMKRSQHFGYYDKYHTDEVSAQNKYHEEFSKLLDLQESMRVLEAGCGQGVEPDNYP
jgi:cyclopropane fatty-acyl-phospholipid synthase-like methyltransferase